MEDFIKKLLQLVEWTYREEQAFMENLSKEEQRETGTFEKWSARDIIAHNSFWKNRRLQDISLALNGGSPARIENYNEINKQVFEENKNKYWDEIKITQMMSRKILPGQLQLHQLMLL